MIMKKKSILLNKPFIPYEIRAYDKQKLRESINKMFKAKMLC